MIKLFIYLIPFLLFASCHQGIMEEENLLDSNDYSFRSVHDLCFVSYNIQGFCGPVPGPIEDWEINNVCHNLIILGADVINLQEVWCVDLKDKLIACLAPEGYIDHLYDQGAGLLTISKYEFIPGSEGFIPFGIESGTDALKDKGFIFASIELEEGCVYNIINTHLQADPDIYSHAWNFLEDAIRTIAPPNPFRDEFLGFNDISPSNLSVENIRFIQLALIKQYMMSQSECTPIIVGGDFNISFESSEFENMLKLVLGQPTFVVFNGDRTPTNEDGTKILDYFFIDNVSGFYSNGSAQTFVSECLEGYEIENFHVVMEYFLEESILRSFGTVQEAQSFIDNQEYALYPAYIDISTRGNFDYKKLSFSTRREATFFCTKRIRDASDHNMIQTCFTYDCQEQVECNDTDIIIPVGDECIDTCPPGFKCIKGHCIEL